LWDIDFHVKVVDKVAILGDVTGHFFAKVGIAVEGLFQCLDSEITITQIDGFKKGYLRINGEKYIFFTSGNDL
jgi:hypothetical protein